MLNKLAFRNVLRSAKDYIVYFLTMTLVTAIMFAFHSLIFSEDLQQISKTAGILAVLIGLASFFVVLIVAWLINYMVRFILEKRSREFGIYMLIGMKKKKSPGSIYGKAWCWEPALSWAAWGWASCCSRFCWPSCTAWS